MKVESHKPIKAGQRVFIRPEWQDAGDDQFTWRAVSDEDMGRVDISPVDTGLAFAPIQTVDVSMLCDEP